MRTGAYRRLRDTARAKAADRETDVMAGLLHWPDAVRAGVCNLTKDTFGRHEPIAEGRISIETRQSAFEGRDFVGHIRDAQHLSHIPCDPGKLMSWHWTEAVSVADHHCACRDPFVIHEQKAGDGPTFSWTFVRAAYCVIRFEPEVWVQAGFINEYAAGMFDLASLDVPVLPIGCAPKNPCANSNTASEHGSHPFIGWHEI
jgi:hypothetical protein